MRSDSTDARFGDKFAGRLFAAQESDSELGRLFQGCRDYLLWVAQSELPDDVRQKVAPSDVVQETFVDAQQLFREFEDNSATDFRAWLRQILLNNVGDAVRRYRHTQKRDVRRERDLNTDDSKQHITAGIPSREPSPSNAAHVREIRNRVLASLDRLQPEYRRVIELRNFEQRSFQDIGPMMNRSPDAARMLWGRAMRQLSSEVRRHDESTL